MSFCYLLLNFVCVSASLSLRTSSSISWCLGTPRHHNNQQIDHGPSMWRRRWCGKMGRSIFARYMWVLKFHSNWCALLLHPNHNTTKVLDKTGGLSSLFLLKLVICSLGCEDELQLACIYIHFIVFCFCLFVSVLVFLLLFFMTLFICALPLQYKYSMVQHVMKENSCDSSPWICNMKRQNAYNTKYNTLWHSGAGVVGRKDQVDRNLKREGGKLVFVSLCFNYSTIW